MKRRGTMQKGEPGSWRFILMQGDWVLMKKIKTAARLSLRFTMSLLFAPLFKAYPTIFVGCREGGRQLMSLVQRSSNFCCIWETTPQKLLVHNWTLFEEILDLHFCLMHNVMGLNGGFGQVGETLCYILGMWHRTVADRLYFPKKDSKTFLVHVFF